MELQKPSVLAQLLKPLEATSSGRYHFGHSFGLVAAKKRKRHEIAVAVDGEGVNIYSVSLARRYTFYGCSSSSHAMNCVLK